jgi:hypothetical protein
MSQSPSYKHTNTGIADTGVSSHYLRSSDSHTITGNTKPTITVGIPNGNMLQSTMAACQLSLPQLLITAREAHILPGLAHSSLLSIGKLCNAGCEAKFDDQQVVITKNNISLLRGERDRCTGLWRIPLTNNAESPKASNRQTKECNNTINISPHNIHNNPDANIEHSTVCYNAYQHHKIPELIQYLQAVAFSPVPSTWIAAIQRGFSQSWPGLTTAAVRKHLPKSEATTKGHINQTRKNLRPPK